MPPTLTYINEISVKLKISLMAVVAVVMTIVGANQGYSVLQKLVTMLNLVRLSSTLLYLIHFEATAQGSRFHMHTFRNSSAFKWAKGAMPRAGSVCHCCSSQEFAGALESGVCA